MQSFKHLAVIFIIGVVCDLSLGHPFDFKILHTNGDSEENSREDSFNTGNSDVFNSPAVDSSAHSSDLQNNIGSEINYHDSNVDPINSPAVDSTHLENIKPSDNFKFNYQNVPSVNSPAVDPTHFGSLQTSQSSEVSHQNVDSENSPVVIPTHFEKIQPFYISDFSNQNVGIDSVNSPAVDSTNLENVQRNHNSETNAYNSPIFSKYHNQNTFEPIETEEETKDLENETTTELENESTTEIIPETTETVKLSKRQVEDDTVISPLHTLLFGEKESEDEISTELVTDEDKENETATEENVEDPTYNGLPHIPSIVYDHNLRKPVLSSSHIDNQFHTRNAFFDSNPSEYEESQPQTYPKNEEDTQVPQFEPLEPQEQSFEPIPNVNIPEYQFGGEPNQETSFDSFSNSNINEQTFEEHTANEEDKSYNIFSNDNEPLNVQDPSYNTFSNGNEQVSEDDPSYNTFSNGNEQVSEEDLSYNTFSNGNEQATSYHNQFLGNVQNNEPFSSGF